MSPRKPARPTRRFPSISVLFRNGRWRFRACIRVDGRQRVGPLRDSQQDAFEDVDQLREMHPTSGGAMTIANALQRLIDNARARGQEEYVVDGVWLRPGNALLRYWPDRKALESISSAEVVRYIIWALDGDEERGQKPVCPRTIKGDYLRVLRSALQLAGLSEAPVQQALLETRARMRRATQPVAGFEVEEVAEVLQRIRTFRPPRAIKNQDLDLLLFEIVATTGVRSGELARLKVRDVDFERGTLSIEDKTRARPRLEPIVPSLRERLRAHVDSLESPDEHVTPRAGKLRKNMPDWDPCAVYLNHMCGRWQRRLKEPRLNLRALRRAHGTGLDTLGSRYSVIRSALGHSRTSDQTPRYLTAASREVIAAKQRLADHFLPRADGDQGRESGRPEPSADAEGNGRRN